MFDFAEVLDRFSTARKWEGNLLINEKVHSLTKFLIHNCFVNVPTSQAMVVYSQIMFNFNK